MFGIESLSGNAHAAALVALVLAEAMLLYVGYGAVEQVLGEYVVQLMRGE